MKGIIILFVTYFIPLFQISAQRQHFEDTLFNESNKDKVIISPNPILGGEYFKIKFPERDPFKNMELMDVYGNKINTSPILFSKMGMYMPKVKPGEYFLKIELMDYTIVKKVNVN